MVELGGLALSYAAGALSTLSPCVLPLLPIILFGALEQHAWGPVALAAGLSASFAGVGIFLASLAFNMALIRLRSDWAPPPSCWSSASFCWFLRFRADLRLPLRPLPWAAKL